MAERGGLPARPGDDQLKSPSVTPDPAPSDDQLVKLAGAAGVASAVLVLLAWRWFRRNLDVQVTRR